MAFAAEWVFVPICLWPLALAALVFGLRGRKVDDHPFCRRCGCDLFGRTARLLPARGASSGPISAACPGCEAGLGRRGTVGIGRRQRRTRLALASLPPLLLCTAWIGLATWYAAETCDWQAHKPDWWLVAETDSRDPHRRDAAWMELTGRMADGKLPRSRSLDLTTLALAGQADATRPWLAAWGEWIERAHEAGVLTDEQWRRYAGQAVRFRLEVRPKVRRGDPLVLRLSVAAARVAAGRRFGLDAGFAGDLWVDGHLVRCAQDVPRIVVAGGVSAQPPGGAVSSRTVRYDLGPMVLGRLVDGPQRCRVSFDALVGERADGVDPPLAETHVELEAPWELLPARVSSVRLVHDTPAAPVGQLAISAGCRWVGAGRERLRVDLVCQDLPVAVAADVFIRAGDREWAAGQIAWNKGTAGASVNLETGPLPPEAAVTDKVDLILRPSVAVAARGLRMMEIWGEPVVVRDVEVIGGAAPPDSAP